jgi:hypothetical protein
MRIKLNWVDVLNEQTRWTGRGDLINWASVLAGRPLHLLDGTVDGFDEALGYMRRSLDNLHANEPVDLLWLDTQLKTVTLGLLHYQGAQPGEDGRFPLFRARTKGMHDTDLLRAIKDTLLIQFAEYIGDVLDAPEQANVFHCEACSLLYMGTQKARFCSDACRFETIHLQNQVENLPTNKRRYRRQNKA